MTPEAKRSRSTCSWGPPFFHLHRSSLPCDRLSPALALEGLCKVHESQAAPKGSRPCHCPRGAECAGALLGAGARAQFQPVLERALWCKQRGGEGVWAGAGSDLCGTGSPAPSVADFRSKGIQRKRPRWAQWASTMHCLLCGLLQTLSLPL